MTEERIDNLHEGSELVGCEMRKAWPTTSNRLCKYAVESSSALDVVIEQVRDFCCVGRRDASTIVFVIDGAIWRVRSCLEGSSLDSLHVVSLH